MTAPAGEFAFTVQRTDAGSAARLVEDALKRFQG